MGIVAAYIACAPEEGTAQELPTFKDAMDEVVGMLDLAEMDLDGAEEGDKVRIIVTAANGEDWYISESLYDGDHFVTDVKLDRREGRFFRNRG